MFYYHYVDGVKKKIYKLIAQKYKILNLHQSNIMKCDLIVLFWKFWNYFENIKPTRLNTRLPASLMSPSTLTENQKDLSLKYLQYLCSRSFQQRVHGIDMIFKYKPTTHTGSLMINYCKNPGCLCLSFSFSLILSLSERTHVSWTALHSAVLWRRWMQKWVSKLESIYLCRAWA